MVLAEMRATATTTTAEVARRMQAEMKRQSGKKGSDSAIRLPDFLVPLCYLWSSCWDCGQRLPIMLHEWDPVCLPGLRRLQLVVFLYQTLGDAVAIQLESIALHGLLCPLLL
ncbi:hypothetical protein ACQJBY_067730 [Aegilops geniculata]